MGTRGKASRLEHGLGTLATPQQGKAQPRNRNMIPRNDRNRQGGEKAV